MLELTLINVQAVAAVREELFLVEVDIGRPRRRRQNAGRLAPAQLLNSSKHGGAGCFRLILLARCRDIIEAAPEAINPDRAFQFMVLAGEPITTCLASDSRHINREFIGVLGRVGCGRGEQHHEQGSFQHGARYKTPWSGTIRGGEVVLGSFRPE